MGRKPLEIDVELYPTEEAWICSEDKMLECAEDNAFMEVDTDRGVFFVKVFNTEEDLLRFARLVHFGNKYLSTRDKHLNKNKSKLNAENRRRNQKKYNSKR